MFVQAFQTDWCFTSEEFANGLEFAVSCGGEESSTTSLLLKLELDNYSALISPTVTTQFLFFYDEMALSLTTLYSIYSENHMVRINKLEIECKCIVSISDNI